MSLVAALAPSATRTHERPAGGALPGEPLSSRSRSRHARVGNGQPAVLRDGYPRGRYVLAAGEPDSAARGLILATVLEPKARKNRVHLEVNTARGGAAGAAARLPHRDAGPGGQRNRHPVTYGRVTV